MSFLKISKFKVCLGWGLRNYNRHEQEKFAQISTMYLYLPYLKKLSPGRTQFFIFISHRSLLDQ